MSTAGPQVAGPQVTEIYTDGACSGNPGPGGWGTLIEFADGQRHELGGRDPGTTNNRMEMQAALSALEYLDEANVESGEVILHTDSEYLKNGITKWIKGWKRKGWKTSAGKPVLNKDLWQQLDTVTQTLSSKKLSVDWRYVRGHTGNPGNERCDEIARAFSHAQPINLAQYKTSGKKAKVSKSTPAQKAASPAQAKNHKDISLTTPEINTATTEEPIQEPALKSYDSDQNLGKEPMATSDSKGSAQGVSRVERLRNTLETLQVTDELAKQGYLITSAELADLMDVNASAVTSRGDYWAWRNWTVSRIRREGNQILWQLERIDE
ncbi:MAG: ribonuclease HI [Cyanobacteria bacterium P01_F01_bin.53]